jgi:Kelch motif
LDNENT